MNIQYELDKTDVEKLIKTLTIEIGYCTAACASREISSEYWQVVDEHITFLRRMVNVLKDGIEPRTT